MKLCILFFSFLFVQVALSADLVSQPGDCLAKKKAPCTFKSISRTKITIAQVEFVFLKDSVVRITDFKNLNIEPLVGGFIIKTSQKSVTVKEVQLAKFPTFVNITKGQVEVVDGKDFYTIRLGAQEPERYLLDREPFIKKLSGFYNNKYEFRSEFKSISPIYNKSFKQDLVLQKKILTRKIASTDEEKQRETEKQRRMQEERKRNRAKFFQRTFDQ